MFASYAIRGNMKTILGSVAEWFEFTKYIEGQDDIIIPIPSHKFNAIVKRLGKDIVWFDLDINALEKIRSILIGPNIFLILKPSIQAEGE